MGCNIRNDGALFWHSESLQYSLAQFKYLFMALFVLGKHKPLENLLHQANRCLGFQSTHFKAWSGMEKKDELQIRLSS